MVETTTVILWLYDEITKDVKLSFDVIQFPFSILQQKHLYTVH